MAYAKALVESYGLNFELVLTLTIVLVLASLIVLAIMKLFKAAIGVGIAFIVIPMMFNLFFGDGSAMIKQAAEHLPPEKGQQLEESYDYFKQRESQDQLIDTQKIQEAAEEAKNNVHEKLQDTGRELQQILPEN